MENQFAVTGCRDKGSETHGDLSLQGVQPVLQAARQFQETHDLFITSAKAEGDGVGGKAAGGRETGGG